MNKSSFPEDISYTEVSSFPTITQVSDKKETATLINLFNQQILWAVAMCQIN